MSSLLQKLAIGDMRTTGKSTEVVKMVLVNPEKFGELFSGLTHADPGVRMRAADALEKSAAKNPALLQSFTAKLIHIAQQSTQQEVQWHCAQMLGYVSLTSSQQKAVENILSDYYRHSPSHIVKVFALTTLFHLTQDKSLLQNALQSGVPSLAARARKLMQAASPTH